MTLLPGNAVKIFVKTLYYGVIYICYLLLELTKILNHRSPLSGNYGNLLSLKNISWNQLFSKTLLSRNFCQKCVWVNFRNFHIVNPWRSMEMNAILSQHIFDKIFVKAPMLLKSWFHEIFFGKREFLSHTFLTKIPWK